MIWSRRWFDDPWPGTKADRGDGIYETYLGHGIWETISDSDVRDA